MKMLRLIRFLVVVLVASGVASCAVDQHAKGSRRTNAGQVFLYLFSPQKPAMNVSFAVSGVGFMDSNGEWVDMSLDGQVDSAAVSEKQMKLSEFHLPAGKYKRMKLKLSEATVKRGAKTFSLSLPEPEGEHLLDVEFVVFPRESLTLFVDWNADESIFNKYLFKPKMAIRKQGIEIKKILLYVTNSESDCVTVIDRQRDVVVATIAVGKSPKGIVVNSGRTRVYVANSGSNSISVIDTDATKVTKTISNFGYSPTDLALSGDDRWLYAINPDSDNVSVIDTVSQNVSSRITVGRHPSAIAYDQVRGKIYVANKAENSVSIIDVDSLAVESTVTVGLGPSGLAVEGDKLYVANTRSNTISVIKLASYSVSKTIAVGQGPLKVQSGLSGWVYVSIGNSNDVSFLYTSMDTVTKDVSVGDMPVYMAVDTLRRKLYVVNSLSDNLSIVDLATRKVKGTIDVGRRPHGIALHSE